MISRTLDRISRKLSEEHLIIVDRKVIFFVIGSFFVFWVLVFFRIHGSSIGMWNTIVPESGKERSGLLYGSPRGIRSDEWAAGTPLFLREVEREGFSVQDVIRRPQIFGFLILEDLEQGFSFYWNFIWFGIFFSFFLLLMLLTGNQFWLSVFGSLLLYSSSANQWWSGLVHILPWSMVIVSSMYFLFSKKKFNVLLGCLFLILFSMNYVTTFFYPALAVPLFYLLLAVCSGFFIQSFSILRSAFIKLLRFRLFLGGVLAILFSLFVFGYYQEISGIVHTMVQTVYPGKRISGGGEVSIERLFSGFYDLFYKEGAFPLTFGNVSEASSFVLLFPFLFPALARHLAKRAGNILFVCIGIYILIITYWILRGFSPTLAAFTLLEWSPANRTLMALGIANIVFVIVYLAKVTKDEIASRWWELLGYFITILALHGWVLSKTDPFFTGERVILVSILFGIAALLLRYKKSFAFGILALSLQLSNLTIHPIAQGLAPLREKEVSRYVNRLSSENPESRWLVYGGWLYPNFLTAAGADVFGGTMYTPNLDFLKKLDPVSKDVSIYNRFAHVSFTSIDSFDEIRFTLFQTDSYTIFVNPCNEKLRGSFTYLVMVASSAPTGQSLPCVESIVDHPLSGIFYIYKYKSSE